MRKFGVVLSTFTFGLVLIGLAAGQQQPQKKFGGGGGGGFNFGGFGAGAGGTILPLISREDVKKELDITQEQLDKVPDAVQKALSEVFSDKQYKRLRQIDLQQRGVNAFNDVKVQKELKVTEEQAGNIKTILDDSRKESAELRKEGAAKGGFGVSKEAQEKITALNKETKEKVQGVLTSDQRKQYKQLVGEEFKFETQGFGGFGNKKTKKDAE